MDWTAIAYFTGVLIGVLIAPALRAPKQKPRKKITVIRSI